MNWLNKERLEQVKRLLKDEIEEGMDFTELDIPVIPTLHNENKIILLFNGWSINLKDDGTWYWEYNK